MKIEGIRVPFLHCNQAETIIIHLNINGPCELIRLLFKYYQGVQLEQEEKQFNETLEIISA